MPDILIRDVPDAVTSALARRAEREHKSRAELLMSLLEQAAVVEVEPGRIRLDFTHPRSPRFVWGNIRCDMLRLRGADGATGYLNVYGSGGGQDMTRDLADAKQLAADSMRSRAAWRGR
jgi:hypothetical protein